MKCSTASKTHTAISGFKASREPTRSAAFREKAENDPGVYRHPPQPVSLFVPPVNRRLQVNRSFSEGTAIPRRIAKMPRRAERAD